MAKDTDWVGGSLTNGRYQVTARLGAGGMAVVYRATDRELEREVVIKTPRASLLEEVGFAARFTREVRSLACLAHANIIRVLDVGEHEGAPFAVLQYLSGGSLRDQQERRPDDCYAPAPPESLARWLQRVAAALDYIHQQRFLHRDVKPDNILFDAAGQAYLGDFGLAKALGDPLRPQGTVLTQTGVVAGTTSYIAPERLLGESCDCRVDQYGLAVTAYEWLSGRLPYAGPTPAFVLVQQTTRPPTPLTELVSVSPALASAVQKGLARRPEERYPDCDSFARAVLAAVEAKALVLQPGPSDRAPARPGEPGASAIACPQCGQRLTLQPRQLGKRVRCPSCGQALPATPPGAASKTEPAGIGRASVQTEAFTPGRPAAAQAPRAAPQPVARARPVPRPSGDDNQWKLLLAGAGLFCVLAALVFFGARALFTEKETSEDPEPVVSAQKGGSSNGPDQGKELMAEKKGEEPIPPKPKATDKTTKPDKDKPKGPDKDKPKEPDKNPVSLPRAIDKPNDERKEVGRFVSTGAVLVRQSKDNVWKRMPVDETVQTGEALVSLPGYKSELRLDSGVRLLLWGALKEMELPTPLDRLNESAVTLHNPARGLDADLTLQHGRVYLSHRKEKGPAKVRLRFWHEEVWEITLEDSDTVVGAEFVSLYPPRVKFQTGEEPQALLFLFVMKGKAEVKINYDTFAMQAPPGLAFTSWTNKSKHKNGLEVPPATLPAASPLWNPDRPLPREAQNLVAAREELAALLAKPGKTVEIGLQEALQSSKPDHRILAVRCLGSLGAVSALIDALGDPLHPEVRFEAANALRIWLGRGNGKKQAAKLYDRKERSGILVEKKFRKDEAESVLELLDELTKEDIRQPETYDALLAYLKHSRLEVRELAYGLLMSIFHEEGSKINYNPAGSSEQISQGYEEWRKLLMSKLAPPKKPGG